MKVVVTGGSGLLGRYVVRELSSRGHDVVVLDIIRPHWWEGRYVNVDILDLGGLVWAFQGSDVVIHLAALINPFKHTPERIFRTNALGSFNVLEAAARCGVRKVVFASSEATLGFCYMERRIVPERIPIDESHPLRPQDPYGLSKLVGEEICRAYTRRYGIKTVALRMAWIWSDEEKELCRSLVFDPDRWPWGLWAYIHVMDAARAFGLALEKEDIPDHVSLFLVADDNGTTVDSIDLIRKHYPEVNEIEEGFGGRDSLISNKMAKEILGFAPAYTWRDIVKA
jgi:nucleoside-diphosphate-sugar epimerase